jgi:drug/metabolite transporter (DMT)-like permease
MPYVWMLLGCFSFAWMGQFAGMLGQQHCDWRLVALARGLLVLLAAVLIARVYRAKFAIWGPGMLWMRSIAGSLSLVCTFYALSSLPTSEVLTLTNTFPIWVALLSWPLLRQRPGPTVWLAACCGVAGVFLIEFDKQEFALSRQLAVGLALMAAVCSAIAMLGMNQIKGIHPWAIVSHFSAVATVTVLLAWVVSGPPPLTPLARWDIGLLLLGVGATATLGQYCLTQAFVVGQPARVSIVGLSQILFAMAIEMLLGGPTFGQLTLAGIVLVIAPTAWMMADRAAQT